MYKLGTLIGALALAGVSGVTFAGEWPALPSKAPEPADNPTTEAKVELGKQLYHDPRLSSSGTVACASCHNVSAGGEDNRAGSVGVKAQVGGRSAPTVWNAAFNSVQFWDGRAASLEAQAKGPVTNPIEMGAKSWDDVVARLKLIPGYVEGFGKAFGGADAVTADNAAKAIAAYERTLITPNSAYDKFANGDSGALTEQQQRGLKAFAEVGCVSCHSGPAFNGPALPQGTGFFQKFPTYDNGAIEAQYNFTKDLGRYDVTKNEADKHFFKVPTLRNIALTAPYFHNGKVKNLDDAVRVMAKTQLNKDLDAQQVGDIVAFLNGLTGEFPKQEIARLPAYAGKTFDFE
ncbi:cytochrome-c peroxidase [Methylococcus sp. EFPC2]|uniref:cytochrome-c peroxidase n=1 Tax=Methylococcus sp. EFPC2 TaxID=2812648 RepID=UPI00196783F4|nr:cytochrome-c peroxidase [Methylococcus sp. EFPC2]QSA97226.1 cytochrome-c peroxidase [Methylococcus sp. EFPC2]